jgi:NADPH2:quinone reductase
MLPHAAAVAALLCAAAATAPRAAVPPTMDAVVASAAASAGDLSKVSLHHGVKVPTARPGQVLIQVAASSVNPVDWKVIETGGGFGVFRFPHTIGFDLAGTVVQCPGCQRVQLGDEVWADNGEFWPIRGGELGAYAQYALSDETQVAPKPTNLNWTDAASLPLVGLTSLQALQETGAPDGPRWRGRAPGHVPQVLITSGAGGTGFVAVQLAKAWGANVTAVGGPADEAFIRAELGADAFIDYTQHGNIFEVMANNSLDVVYDNYGAAGTADQAMPALKPGGAFVFLPGKGGALSRHPKEGVQQINYGLCRSTNHTDLEMLRALVQGGQLRPHVQAVFPLADVPAAFRLSMEGHVQGKLALAVQRQRQQQQH